MEKVRLAGLPDVLRAVGQKGITLGVLSSNSEANIRICLRSNGVEDLFRFIESYPLILGKARGITPCAPGPGSGSGTGAVCRR